jgi:hypothetical protein
MPTRITIKAEQTTFAAELNDSESAAAFAKVLPTTIRMSRWGDEYYGSCGISVSQSADAREETGVGELALWPPGNALCIFFGPTPASRGSEPRAASPVNPIGRLLDSPDPLRKMGSSISAEIALA